MAGLDISAQLTIIIEKNKKRKIHSSGGYNFNEHQNKLINDLDFLLVKGHTPSYNEKNF